MKKIIYTEENFISPDECQRFIDLSLANKGKEMPYGDETRGGDTYLTTVEWKDHTAVYLGCDQCAQTSIDSNTADFDVMPFWHPPLWPVH